MLKNNQIRLMLVLWFLAVFLWFGGSAQAATTVDVDTCPIELEGLYVQALRLENEDGTYKIATAVSTDQKKWILQSEILSSQEALPEVEMRKLGDIYLIENSQRNGEVLYYSMNGKKWIETKWDLAFVDICYNDGWYYAATAEGIIYTSQYLDAWVSIARLPEEASGDRKVTDLSVNSKTILVGHYNTNWGAENYKNGLEVYNRGNKTWTDTTGYINPYGVLDDIIWTGQSFVLCKRNIYDTQVSVAYYTSTAGTSWKALSGGRVELVRALNLLIDKDTQIWKMTENLKDEISAYASRGGRIAVGVLLEGESISFEASPLLVDGRVLVPVRKLFEILGGEVSWDGANKKVTGTIDDTQVVLYINDRNALINGEVNILDVPAQIINGSTYVPIRFIAQSSGINVKWDADNYQVLMTH